MKRFILSIAFLCLIATGANSFWQSRDSNYNSVAGPAAYVGPGDLATFIDWWGFRCYNLAYNGPIADINDAATGNTTGTRLQCTGPSGNGVVSAVVSSSACTFITGNACSTLAATCASGCKVRTLYTQTGTTNCAASTACNATQATLASQPTFTTSGPNGKYNMSSTGALALATTNRSLATQTVPIGAYSVFNASSTGAAYVNYGGASASLAYNNVAGDVTYYNGTTVIGVAASASAWHDWIVLLNGASSTGDLDGSRTSPGNPGTAGLVTGSNYAMGSNNSGAGTTLFTEGGWVVTAGTNWTTTIQNALHANLASYYCSGGSFPC